MDKVSQLQSQLKTQNIDGVLITNPINRRYMTGFTGTSGIVVISREDAIFITDFRYIEQANQEVSNNFTIKEHKGPIVDTVAEIVDQLNLTSIGFEQQHLTYAAYEQYRKKLKTDFVPTSDLIDKIRLIKSENELSILKEACNIADKAYDYILDVIKPGVKEIDVANELEFYMRRQGAQSSSFDIIVASGYRGALPHGVASTKKIQAGELVTLDFGAIYQGYCSDITRTVAVGAIDEELHTIYETVLSAQKKGVEGIQAGLTCKEADALTRDHIKAAGYGEYFGHATGHGLGLEVHEQPALSYRSTKPLEAGMVVTVEPGIYVPNVGGCRIEDDIVITENGNERLSHANKELVQLPG
ncbi:peptidase M24 [Gracilibacillus halophilus YIM-C55.5]|uniref:Peptidase M24 n=1 Tax=Gracilibacillus halophilus YIM-C55.5 TaxID=1308866 RepID=N4WDX0_9BACI|nr:Xaa-Pro peptidase family protein [Gracilibacillus halophilus]ENH97444.1 peptidase M24 [Gracilibacillus halophilus YIM-C55.5]